VSPTVQKPPPETRLPLQLLQQLPGVAGQFQRISDANQ